MKAAIIGYGKSGKAVHELLKLDGYEVVDIYDNNEALGYQPIAAYTNMYNITIVSPGVDLKKYKNVNGNLSSEIAFADKFRKEGAKIIGITGTNGKSTTTHLVAQLLNNAGINAVACGNIGLAYAEAVQDTYTDVFVLEMSSFQIDLLRLFSITAGSITNVTQDHIDRYGSMDNYYQSKLRIIDFIEVDGLLVADDDEKIKKHAEIKHINKQYISVDDEISNVLDFGKFSVNLDSFKLFGKHNLLNLKYALMLADSVADFQGDVSNLLEGLSSMAHRTEVVATYNGVTYINDSKGTNVESVITALKSVEKPAMILLGGRDKNSDYTPLIGYINNSIDEVCYFGEARDIIKSQLTGKVEAKETSHKTLLDAVIYCRDNAKQGSTVILSPACTSFDEFKSFEHRGEMFAEYVHMYAGSDT